MNGRQIAAILAALVLTGGLGGSAAFASPSTQQYSGVNATQLKGPYDPCKGKAGEKSPCLISSAPGALPFTGFQAAIAVLGGAALLAGGIALRRFGRPRKS